MGHPPPINFNYANISLLKALFGEKTTSQIITLEIENQKKSKKMRNSYAITENQIFDILFGKGFNNEISNKESLSQKSLNTYALSKNQVNNLSSKQPTTNLVLSLLNYRNIDSSPPVSWTDPKTNITVRLD
jgi:hypothetical protein